MATTEGNPRLGTNRHLLPLLFAEHDEAKPVTVSTRIAQKKKDKATKQKAATRSLYVANNIKTMTIPLYPAVVVQNDLSPDHGGAKVDELCEDIHKATKGWGANKKKTIDALATQDATTRYYMAIRYKELYSQELQEVMKKEFSGDLGLALRWLALPADQAEAKMIKEASKGIGAQVNIIWSILVGRTNDEMTRLKKAYFDMYTKDLGKLLSHELTGDMERLIFNCLQASEEQYDPQFHTAEKAKDDADFIHSLGQGRWGTNERGLFKIICASPKEHLENISA